MHNRYCLLILAALLYSGAGFAEEIRPVEYSTGKVKFSVDPRMELLAAVNSVSGTKYLLNRNSPYTQTLSDYFAPFSQHIAATPTTGRLEPVGFSLSAPVALMLYLSQPPQLKRQAEYPDQLSDRIGGSRNLDKYRKYLKRFAKASDYEAFWSSQILFYNKLMEVIAADLGRTDKAVRIVEEYLGESRESYDIIISPSFSGGKSLDHDGKDNTTICLGDVVIKDGIPYFESGRILPLLWHEIVHRYETPLYREYAEMTDSSSRLLARIDPDSRARQIYVTWGTIVREHIVNAVVIRLIAQQDASAAQSFLRYRMSNEGLIYLEPLIEKLKEFERQREEDDVTFSVFFPELLKVFDDIK